MFNLGSTAVLSTSGLPFIVAVKQTGIYTFSEGEWHLQYPLSKRIYKLVQIGDYIFGIGDSGTIVRYDSIQRKWTHTEFPTKQCLWDITGNERGLIVTHSGSRLFLSENFGSSWKVMKPFEAFANKPMIRSLLCCDNYIYIGTQIHKENGGLWKYHLQTGKLSLVKRERRTMISSIHLNDDSYLFVTTGNGTLGEGVVQVRHPYTNSWLTFYQSVEEKAFLDIFSANNKLYATSSKDSLGYSRIYEVSIDEMTLFPIETVEGHSFRGAGYENQLFISSPVESKWISNCYKTAKLLH